MVIQMTREEYQAKYGVPPVVPSSTKVDTTPAITKMTKEEYNAKYGLNPVQPTQQTPSVTGTLLAPTMEGISGLKTLYGGGEQGIAQKLKRDIQGGADAYQQSLQGTKNPLVAGANLTLAGGRIAGDVAGTVYAPIGAVIGATGIGKVFDYLGALSQKGGKYNPINAITDMKMVQDFVGKNPQLSEDFGRALNIAFAAADKGQIEPSTVVPRTIEQISNAKSNLTTKIDTFKENRNSKLVQATADEIAQVENKYVKGRNANLYSKDNGVESRNRIAQSGVLKGSVDENGLVITKGKGGAVEQYKQMTVKPAEGVVRTLLAQEGGATPLSVVEQGLMKQVSTSGLEGADLVSAMNGVKKEIAGLRLKADPSGNIPNTLIHDAKINTTNNINFQTPPETATYRKAVARGYKTLVETRENPTFDAGKINAELGKYYDDIARLDLLDGARVSGGKLGKYTAQISGNIVGGAFGSMLGPIGTALGTVAGGEVASFIKGKGMSQSFSNSSKAVRPKSSILDNAMNMTQENNLGNRKIR